MRLLAVPLAAVSLALVAVAAPARAQEEEPEAAHDVVVLSVGGDASEAAAREAREAVAAALEADGLRVLPEGELSLRVPPSRLRGCDSVACAWALGRELGVSMVAAVATWQAASGPSSVSVSLVVGMRRSHAASEDVGAAGLAAAAARAVRGAQASRQRALLLEGSSPRVTDEPEPPREPAEPAPVQRERSLEEYVLPTILGVVGLAFAAGAVYALMPEECELAGPSGICLRGHGPNVGLGVVLSVAAGLSIGGAILWLVLGGSPPAMQGIDVVIGPEGGGLSWTRAF